MLPALAHVENWIFDLDNCLYPASSNLFELIDQRMTDYVQQRFGLDRDAARALQKRYFHEHGTTLSGLMTANEIDPHEFLDFVHDIHALSYVPKPDPRAYQLLCERHEIDPARALFAEDMARNLKPAKALGMVTVWVDNGSEQANNKADPDHIDFHTHDIGAWLAEATGAL
jgi:putative hydrolase of the HAD superfamily